MGDERRDDLGLIELVFGASGSESVGIEEGGGDFASASMDHNIPLRSSEGDAGVWEFGWHDAASSVTSK